MKNIGTLRRHTLVAGLLLIPAIASAQGPVSTAKLTGPSGGNTVDLAWKAGVNGGSLFNAFVLPRSGGTPGSFGWIGASPTGTLTGGQPDQNLSRFAYIYTTTFTGGSFTGATFQCALDDQFVSAFLNGVAVAGGGCSQYTFT